MIINKINFPIYATFIIVSLLIGVIFNYISLKKNGLSPNLILLFILFSFYLTLFGGFLYTTIVTKKIYNIGLSSYGGAIGFLISVIIFERNTFYRGKIAKNVVISLPLIYSISKLACFFSGCCFGIPYNGAFSVIYNFGLNIPVFPIQFVETIIFMIIFLICFKFKKSQYIIGITIFISALSKFLLDFFRYSHLNVILSTNQMVSCFFIGIGIGLILKKFLNKKIQ